MMHDWHFHNWATAEAFRKAQMRQQHQVARAKRRQKLQVCARASCCARASQNGGSARRSAHASPCALPCLRTSAQPLLPAVPVSLMSLYTLK